MAKLKARMPEAKLITGNTECRLEQKFRKIEYKRQIYTRNVSEINQIEIKSNKIEIGSAVTINEIKVFLENRLKLRRRAHLRLLY